MKSPTFKPAQWNAIIDRAFALDDEHPFLGQMVEDDAEQLTALGGKGSGNFDHAGRPGAVGGSAKGAMPRSYEELAKHLKTEGLHLVSVADMPKDLGEKMGGMTDPQAMSPAMAEGIAEGFATLKADAPVVYDRISSGTPITYAAYDPPATATTVSKKDGASWLFINGSKASRLDLAKAEKEQFHVGMINAVAKGLKGDALAREVYKASIIHEAGHVVDAALGKALTGNVMSAALDAGIKQDDMPSFFAKVSPYARDGGPSEATAEVFTAAILNLKLPPELHDVAEEIRQLARGKAKS